MKMENTKDIIKITERDGAQVVSARELHRFLEIGKDFSTWIKDRIEKYGFVENQDFEIFPNYGENSQTGRRRIEYALTIDMAKELSMVENNERGRTARRYFIECEKRLREQRTASMPNFSNPAEAARAWADQYERNLALEAKNEEMKPKADYFDCLVDRKLNINFRDTAKEIGLRQNDFIKRLIEAKYVYRDAKGQLKPYAAYVDSLFIIKECKGGEKWAGNQTLVTPRGREAFRMMFGERM